MTKLDDARSAGKFSEAEIALLREKLSLVVSAFGAEKSKYESDFEKLAAAAQVELSEREYALSSAALELTELKKVIACVEAREEATRDDLDEALTANEILKAQLIEEHECASALRNEVMYLRESLRDASEALSRAAEEEERRAYEAPRRAEDDIEARVKEETLNAKIARLEEKVIDAREENATLKRELAAAEGTKSDLQRAVAERDGAQTFLKSQLADWNQRLYARSEGGGASSEATSTSDTSVELRTKLDQAEIELGAKTGAVKALERRVREQDKSLERARAEIEKMRVKLIARDEEVFERKLTARRGREERAELRSKYDVAAEATAAEVIETLRTSRTKHADKSVVRNRTAHTAASKKPTGTSRASIGRKRRAERVAPPASVVIDATAPYEPPNAAGDEDEDEQDDSDSEYDEVDVPVKKTRAPPAAKSAKKPNAPAAVTNENAVAAPPAAPANEGIRMPLGMIQMPKLGAKKAPTAEDGEKKKRRLNRQSAIPEALPNLLFGIGEGDLPQH